MAVRTSLMEFQIPKIVHEEIDENRGVFQIEPLDRGFGYTFGNSLRRVLLSSLEGAAVTSVKIEGVAHEFTTLPGVREDVTDILLNFKNLIARLHGDSPEIEVRLSKRGAGSVTAKDIEAPAELEILNPDLEIANLSDKGKLEVTLTIGRGRGYVPAELNRGPEHTIGVIPVDSIFSPVRRVSYDVEAARVGQRTDYDKLILDVTTDGSLDPRDAIGQAAEILIRLLADQDLGRLADRVSRVERAVGRNVEDQLVVVGTLADAGGLDVVRDAPDRREDRVDRDDADRVLRPTVQLSRDVAAAAADRQRHLEPAFVGQVRDLEVGVEDLELRRGLDVLGRDCAGSTLRPAHLDLRRVAMQALNQVLEVEQDVGDVLANARQGRELVRDALDLDRGDRGALERGEQHAAQRVAECVAEAAIERLDLEDSAVLVDLFVDDLRDLELHQTGSCSHFAFLYLE